MTRSSTLFLAAAFIGLLVWNVPAGTLGEKRTSAVRDSLAKSGAYLLSKQMDDGSWFHHPAITSLVCVGLINSPQYATTKVKAAVERGLDFVVKFAKPDGSIWTEGNGQYPNYCTSVSLIALAAADRPQDRALIRKARDFIMGPNSQFSNLKKSDPSYGGIGYGHSLRPDLSNTQWALEALAMTDHLDREPLCKDPERAKKADLAWDRAATFLTRCQNLAETNKAGWVMSDPDNKGGFIYMPGCDENGLPPESKAGEEDMGGRKGLRSYGSMTYAGLKSMLYAKLKKDDVRVKAAHEWIRRHFTFDKNPGIGAEGHFYYLHTVSKALSVYGEDTLVDDQGVEHNWRAEFIDKLLAMQKPEGFWVNEASGRWMESMPELVTAYGMMAMEIAAGDELK
jgi:squalene-hopene/tetraprenyl-beta-curcumene cyclase